MIDCSCHRRHHQDDTEPELEADGLLPQVVGRWYHRETRQLPGPIGLYVGSAQMSVLEACLNHRGGIELELEVGSCLVFQDVQQLQRPTGWYGGVSLILVP